MMGSIEIAEVQEPYFNKDGPMRFYCIHDEDTGGWEMHKADEWWSERLEPPTSK
jgi:hypothetical protein